MQEFISGAISGLSGVAALFFIKFWRETRDRLFGILALAFAMMGVERLVIVSLSQGHEAQPTVYFIRLAAFLLILAGIIDKNRS